MRQPGTTITGEDTTTRTLGRVHVEQTIIQWNDTERVSVNYRVGDIDLYADPRDCTSFDEPISDEELTDLLATYGQHGYRLTTSNVQEAVEEMLEAAAGRLSEQDEEGIQLVAAMLDAILDDDAKAARPASAIAGDLIRTA